MGVLEQVTQLKKEGRSDEQIISDLRKQGISPREISDALNHSHIKSAVGDIQGNDNSYGNAPGPTPAPSPQGNQGQYSQEVGQQDQSAYGQEGYQDYGQGQDYNNYAPQDYPQNQQAQYTQPAGGQEYYPQQDYSQGDYSSGYDQYGGGQQANSDTVVEISEQVFDEKISETAKRLDSMEEFKTLTQTKLDSINEKVKRMEAIIDKLQLAILEKVGSYGKDLDSIKKEMNMMQDTFTKSLDPLIGRASRQSSKTSEDSLTEKPAGKTRTRRTSKK